MPPRLRPRILLVEDHDGRAALIKTWLLDSMICVRASSAARAIGIIKRDGSLHNDHPPQYAGIMLDHDLDLQPLNAQDHAMNGQHVAQALCGHFSPDVPVFVHSTNPGGSAAMMAMLRDHGFDVIRCSQIKLQDDPTPLLRWLGEALEIWEDTQE